MPDHYTPSTTSSAFPLRRRVRLSAFFLDFLVPVCWIITVISTWSGDNLVSWEVGITGTLYIIFRIGRRLMKEIESPLVGTLAAGSLFIALAILTGVGLVRWSNETKSEAMALCIGTGTFFLLIATVKRHEQRLEYLEAPTQKDRTLDYPGIYRITCQANGKQYIGQTSKSIRERWAEHVKMLQSNWHHSRWLQADWNLYRPEQFTIEILEVVTDPVWLLDRERYWQDQDYNPERRYNPPNIAPRITRPRPRQLKRGRTIKE